MNWMIILVVWALGVLAASRKVKEWKHNTWYEKMAACLLWPLTVLLYGIHWLHNRN